MTDGEFGRRITVSVRDRRGELVPNTKIEWFAGTKFLGQVIDSDGHANIQLKNSASIVTVRVTRKRIKQEAKLAAGQDSWEFKLPMVLHPTGLEFMREHFAGLVGIVFVLIATALIFVFSAANKAQLHVAFALFALGGGAFSGEFAKWIKVDLKIGAQVAISAVGAAAIFVILFFFIPAGAG